MSWSRFLAVAVLTTTVLVPIAALTGDIVLRIEEPARTGVIVIGAVLIFFVVDRILTWLLHRLDRARRAG